MRSPFLPVLLTLSLATPALASGVDIAWDGCLGDPGAVSLETFACDRNVDEHELFVSFVPAASFSPIQILEVALDLQTRGGHPLSAWWDFSSPAGCRLGQFGAGLQVSSTPGCEGWSPPPDFSTNRFNYHYATPDGAHIVFSTRGINTGVLAGHHYIACRVVLSHARTVGTGSCTGCLDPVDITVSGVRIATLTSEQLLTQPQANARVLWQDSAVPTRASTWSALKSLYR